MRAGRYSICVLIFCLAVFQCGSPADPDNNNHQTQGITFTVTDNIGDPIDSVGVHMRMEFNFSSAVSAKHSRQYHQVGLDSIVPVEPSIPSEFSLAQNYPNPFNPLTTIGFALPEETLVLLIVTEWWDSTLVRTLVDTTLPAGLHKVNWDARNDDGDNVTNNFYTYQITAGSFSDEKDMCLLMMDPEHIRGLDCIPLVSTDEQGKANLDYDVLPVWQTTNRTDADGNLLSSITVSGSMDFIFLKHGYEPQIESVSINTAKVLNLAVTMLSSSAG